jgi:hypothetical protein
MSDKTVQVHVIERIPEGDGGETGNVIQSVLSMFSLKLQLSNGVPTLKFKVDTYATEEDMRSIEKLPVTHPMIAVRPILIGVCKRTKTYRYRSAEPGSDVVRVAEAESVRKKLEVTKMSHAGGLFFSLYQPPYSPPRNVNTWIDIKDALKSYLDQFVMVNQGVDGKNYIWNNRKKKWSSYFDRAVATGRIGNTLLVRMKLAVVLDCAINNTTPTKYAFHNTHFVGDSYELKVYCKASSAATYVIDNIYLA